jgi:nucleoside-diphosphate-sugar epimerase
MKECGNMSMLSEKRVLVTGSTGFIGKKFTERIRKSGFEVIEIPENLDLEEDKQTLDFVTSTDPTHIVHLASNRNHERELPSEQLQFQISNIDHNIISACQKLKNLHRFVSIGTCDEYGKQNDPYLETTLACPISAYGQSKLALTKLLVEISESKNFPSVTLRPSVVYGTNQSPNMFIPSLFVAMQEQKRIPLTKGEQTRDFVHVDDVVDAIFLSLTSKNIPNGSILNIGTQRSLPVKSVAIMIADLFGSTHKSLLGFGILEYRPSEVMNYRVNAEKAMRVLTWKPKISLEDGLKNLKESIGQKP